VIRRNEPLHPRLTVVPVDGRARPEIDAGPGRTVVGHAQLASAMEAVADRRRAALRERIAGIERDLSRSSAGLAQAEDAAGQRRADRDGFLDAASWAESLPTVVAEGRTAGAAVEADLAERLREAREAARALDRVLDQRASADAAIAEARRQLDSLRRPGVHDPEREQAAAQLAAQAESVEARLTEAEDDARTRSEQTKRAVTELELELERLARTQRERLARLGELVECLPVDGRPPHDEDPLDHVGTVAAGLRDLAAVVDGEHRTLQADADRRRAECEQLRNHVGSLQASLERIAPEDAAEALADLVTSVTDGLVVLDDVVTDGASDHGLLRALEATEASAPVVVLSSDPAVLGWAIDLPADRGAIAGPRTVDLLTTPSTTVVCTEPEQHRLPALTSSPGDHS
jgi:hypothetical protein